MELGRIPNPFLTGFKLALLVIVYVGLHLWLVDDLDPITILTLELVVGLPILVVFTFLMGSVFKAISTEKARVTRHVTEVVEIAPAPAPPPEPVSRKPDKPVFGYGQV